ncbi:NACHT domain-containing protein [Myxococcus fulvus]|uniref:NACHT domain-containing protein n=1 Tax=Myxococcus fulvus TaxID=33 RepID=UPI003B9D44EC
MAMDGTFLGQVCHIEAAEEGGERFNINMTNEERRSFANLMLMCYPHHQVTNDVVQYPVERLRRIKEDHDRRFASPERSEWERLVALSVQSFNEARYLQRHCHPPQNCVELTALPTMDPPNVDSRAHAAPLRTGTGESGARNENHAVPLTQLLISTSIGDTTLLVGDGGSGKSTTLRMALAAAAERRRNDSAAPLPVLLALSRFRGDLNVLINESLGIAQGDWRALPGTFLVFCDGLNELPLEEMASFGDALETPQRRDRIALVVSVRGGGVRGRTHLPSIDRTLKLSPLNKAQMIKMAQQALGMEGALSFLDQLRNRLASRRFELASLPFGFVLVLDAFRDARTLPATDVAVIEVFLGGRLRRARDVPRELAFISDFSDELLMSLAVGVAFELRLAKHLSSMKRSEAQMVLTRVLRRVQQEGMFGADAITSVQAFAWMRHAELLILSVDDWVSFRHDLIADYFAAFALAKDWGRHVDVLKQTYVADDAWFFASGRIPESERAAFTQAVFTAEPALAAQCSLQLGDASQDFVIQAAHEAAEGGNEFAMLDAISVMRRIGNEPSLTWLRDCAEGHERTELMRGRIGFNLLRALAYLGDESVLNWLLNERSSGAEQVWEFANPERALFLARNCLASSGEDDVARTNLCLNTLAQHGDSRDVSILSHFVQSSSNPYLTISAFHALFSIEPTLALELLRPRYMESPDNVGMFLGAIAETGTPLDPKLLIRFVLYVHRENNSDKKMNVEYLIDFKIREPAAKLLQSCSIDIECEELLLSGYKSCPRSRPYIWLVARSHQLSSFDVHAAEVVVVGDVGELGSAVEFARTRTWEAEFHDAFNKNLRHRFETDRTLVNSTFCFYRVLGYLAENGNKSLAASVVTDRVAELAIAQKKIDANEDAWLSWAGPDADFHLQKLSDLSVDAEFGELLPIAAAIADSLSRDTIRIWLDVNFSRFGDRHQQLHLLLRRLGDDELDTKLSTISDEICAAHFLSILVELGITRRRIEAFARLLFVAMSDFRVCFALLKVLPVLWRNDVDGTAGIVAGVVAQSPLSQMQLPVNFVDAVLGRMTKGVAERVVGPALIVVRDSLSREILQLWYDKGMRRRGVE